MARYLLRFPFNSAAYAKGANQPDHEFNAENMDDVTREILEESVRRGVDPTGAQLYRKLDMPALGTKKSRRT